jgi:hypothetical protein
VCILLMLLPAACPPIRLQPYEGHLAGIVSSSLGVPGIRMQTNMERDRERETRFGCSPRQWTLDALGLHITVGEFAQFPCICSSTGSCVNPSLGPMLEKGVGAREERYTRWHEARLEIFGGQTQQQCGGHDARRGWTGMHFRKRNPSTTYLPIYPST